MNLAKHTPGWQYDILGGVSLHTKHTQTLRKHTQTQTANTRKYSPIAKTAIPVQQMIERRPKKKKYS